MQRIAMSCNAGDYNVVQKQLLWLGKILVTSPTDGLISECKNGLYKKCSFGVFPQELGLRLWKSQTCLSHPFWIVELDRNFPFVWRPPPPESAWWHTAGPPDFSESIQGVEWHLHWGVRICWVVGVGVGVGLFFPQPWRSELTRGVRGVNFLFTQISFPVLLNFLVKQN